MLTSPPDQSATPSDELPGLVFIPPGEGFLNAVADLFLAGAAAELPDLSAHLLLVPSLAVAAELRAAISRRAGRALFLPQIHTLQSLAETAAVAAPLAASELRVLFYNALSRRGWFEENALWGMADELARLSDELSAAAVSLPADEAALRAELARAYASTSLQPLAFEAALVHTMWRAQAECGRPDAPSAYRLSLAALAQNPPTPCAALFVVIDAPPAESLSRAEADFITALGQTRRITVAAPLPRGRASAPLARLLAAAWPEDEASPEAQTAAAAGAPPLPSSLPSPLPPQAPPLTRAHRLQRAVAASPLRDRLAIFTARSREDEAQIAAGQIFHWLNAGLRRIAIVAADRLGARRLRALLERHQVLLADESGWKLSTSRAGATVHSLLAIAGRNPGYRDLFDLCLSPYLFADLPPTARQSASVCLEQAVRAASARAGFASFERALDKYFAHATDTPPAVQELARQLLQRLRAAGAIIDGKAAPLAVWLDRLQQALQTLGASAPLAADAAGSALLALLARRQGELAGSAGVFSRRVFQRWLERELEATTFRDSDIVSPLVMLPRRSARLRNFEAVLFIGADAAHLAPASDSVFFNQAVRRQLGLPTRDEAQRALYRDLELIISAAPRSAFVWCAEDGGEARLLAPPLDLLDTVHRLAWGSSLLQPAPAFPRQPASDAALPQPALPPAPALPPPLIPQRLSVSALGTLIGCPYRFLVNHALAPEIPPEIAERVEKRDYGELVHRALERFHSAFPSVAALGEAAAARELAAVSQAVFAAAESQDALALAWHLRWQRQIDAYIAWQAAREAEGWRWQQAETRASRLLPLGDAGSVELYGRIDRMDQQLDHDSDHNNERPPAAKALLDYKTRKISQLKKERDEDLQLAAYAILCPEAQETAYVGLDDAPIGFLAMQGDELALAATAQKARLVAIIGRLQQGAALPANGRESVCAHCEVRGVCRKDHWQPAPADRAAAP